MISLGKFDPVKWHMIGLSIIKSHVRLVSSILMTEASFLISFSNIVSIYDLRLNKWVQNIKLDSKIISMILDENFSDPIIITEKYD
jgi:hypothetical protein